jgi:hypothetical protein
MLLHLHLGTGAPRTHAALYLLAADARAPTAPVHQALLAALVLASIERIRL